MKKIKSAKEGSAVIVSLCLLSFIIIVILSISGIYINKVYTLKNLNNYYDKAIIENLEKR